MTLDPENAFKTLIVLATLVYLPSMRLFLESEPMGQGTPVNRAQGI